MNFWLQAAYFLALPPFMAFIISLVATRLLIRWLRQKQILDIPNGRSNHALPTPRGGGLAVMGACFSMWLLVPLLQGHITKNPVPEGLYTILLAAGALAWLSWQDDKRGLPAKLRLALQLLAVAAGLLTFDTPILGLPIPFWLDRLIAAFAWVWFINLTNFMDGIDGITATQAICMCLCLWMAVMFTDMNHAYLPYIGILGASMAGFLVWNWHPAKIFLGDVGSIPLGFILGWLLLKLAEGGHALAALIIPAYYLLDSTITITRRALQKKHLFEAHSEHAYQKARRGGLSPRRICLYLAGLSLLHFVWIALFYNFPAETGWLWLALAYGSGLLMFFYFNRKHPTLSPAQTTP
jgi:UDP-N-acetylmuramyl pentapeptide phosphotransferase/UDP-N-acetylglucosamine-1-phosphate transferase